MTKYNKTEMSILDGLKDALSFAKGEDSQALSYKVEVKNINVKALRESLDLTQGEFANTFGVSLSTLRNWEQGKREPDGPAKVLLNVISHSPKSVFDAIRA